MYLKSGGFWLISFQHGSQITNFIILQLIIAQKRAKNRQYTNRIWVLILSAVPSLTVLHSWQRCDLPYSASDHALRLEKNLAWRSA